MEIREQLYEGKAKRVYATDDPKMVVVAYKDDATALDGLKRGTIAGKGVVNNRMSNLLFKYLADNGVPHGSKACEDRTAGSNRAQYCGGQLLQAFRRSRGHRASQSHVGVFLQKRRFARSYDKHFSGIGAASGYSRAD